jgi:hypothetical protein
MSQPNPERPTIEIYEIKLKGALFAEWSDWFNGMSLYLDANGNTILSGPVIDQAALYGLLDRLRDLGIELLSITRLT